MQPAHPQACDERPVHGDEIAHIEQRKVEPPGLARCRVDRTRPGAALTAAEQIGRDDEPAVGVDRLARADHGVPPARVLVSFVPARRVRVAGQGMADVDRIAGVRIERSVRLVGNHHLVQLVAAHQRQRIARIEQRDLFRLDDAETVITGGHHSAVLSRACSRSAMMSSTFSMPTDSRTISGATPAAASSSSLSCECVVEALWITSDLASPMLAR